MQTLPDELTRACLIAAMVIVAFMGLLTAWLVRPRDRWADAGSGLATGLVAGMAVFAFGFGSAVIVAFSVVATLPDAATLTDGYQTKTPPPSEEKPRRHPQEELLERYPDLEKQPEHRRAWALHDKMISDEVNGIMVGLWVGLLISFGVYGTMGVYQAIMAGTLLRRRGSLLGMTGAYLEATLCTSFFILVFGTYMGFGGWQALSIDLRWTVMVGSLGVLLFTNVGVWLGWHWYLRVALYGVWVALIALELGRVSTNGGALVRPALPDGPRHRRRAVLAGLAQATGAAPSAAAGVEPPENRCQAADTGFRHLRRKLALQ